ncbi:HAD-IIIC family phosphatase [Acidicapsa acidisoli]|uniref:HAD-IIIC family phosphatase n=1 Tax=Acidicapsa acidisoli TaxID=1615681 RepID=UPI0021DFEA5E|nr:HAD-IIIC family phosphatase [Acidicapsa acidisoli]
MLKRRGLRRKLSALDGLKEIRIAVLGGTTTNELVDLLEILLLSSGFRPTFHQSEYGRYYEDAVLEPESIAEFKPEIVYVHTCSLNIQSFPPVSCSEEALPGFVDAEMNRFRAIWRSLEANVGCQIIQNNFELPASALLGNLDAVSPGGASRFITELNRAIAAEAAANPRLLMQDLNAIAARVGMNQWFDPERWFSYKVANSVEGSFAIATSLNSMIQAIYGRSRKVLVLDLDNTLWGGVIGDDGADKIVLGRETPVAEAYTAFQEYCLRLRERGILLAVCSKNNDDIARSGFAHPDSVLKLEHFSAFKANWEPKHENILEIARELNLGVDSFVFVDDNPAERAIVEAQIPGIAVPEVGSDVAKYAAILDAGRYFEPVSLGKEDLVRAKLYEENAQRAQLEQKFANYGEYLDSLEMTAEIDVFNATYMERIAQLTNKTNQFNLTTRRYTLAEIESTVPDGHHIGIYGKLTDRFGDNGLISIVLGRIDADDASTLHLDLWLMSCRVLKREMEIAMLDGIAERARDQGIVRLLGTYIPTAKNGMVKDHYEKLGFSPVASNDTAQDGHNDSTTWSLDITNYQPRSRHIRIVERVNA